MDPGPSGGLLLTGSSQEEFLRLAWPGSGGGVRQLGRGSGLHGVGAYGGQRAMEVGFEHWEYQGAGKMGSLSFGLLHGVLVPSRPSLCSTWRPGPLSSPAQGLPMAPMAFQLGTLAWSSGPERTALAPAPTSPRIPPCAVLTPDQTCCPCFPAPGPFYM